ncbi:MAG: sugar transferase [Bacteroidales bacterium]|nr:sugar transferase [Bacteroidales bacterium]MCR5549956.1 sugar transferase [Bacteroidales bacterium]
MKRVLDFLCSLVVLVLLLPVWLVVALLIVLESRGGVFYVQKRVGKDNRDFNLYKFRTMRPDSDSKGLLTVGARDSRITRVGYFLRKYKIDEFPQLLNILKGDMSIVGPRPEVRKYVDLYTPEQMRVLSVRPGLTDYASIRYVNENEVLAASDDPERTYIEEVMPAKLALNLQYIDNQSLKEDFKLIFKTFTAILSH